MQTLDEDGTGEPWRRRGAAARRKQMPLWQELPLLLVVAFCLAVLIRTFLLQAFFIPSGSMEDTLLVGDRVLVNKVVYDFRDPERGEVVVFRGTDRLGAGEPRASPDAGFFAKLGRTVGDLVGVSRPGEKDFIKRVIGLPGDRVSCCDAEGRIYVNGDAASTSRTSYGTRRWTCRRTRGRAGSRRFDEVVVPPGQLFVMGDHRLVSQDSRCQGPVPIENVIGRAFVDRLARRPVELAVACPTTFDDVPEPVAAGRRRAPPAPVRPRAGGGRCCCSPIAARARRIARVPDGARPAAAT